MDTHDLSDRGAGLERLCVYLRRGYAVCPKTLWLGPREFDVVAALALEGGPLSVSGISDRIWPDKDFEAARLSLKVTVHRLRRRLGCWEAIVSERGALTLGPAITVDLCEWRSILERVDAGPLDTAARSDLSIGFAALASAPNERFMRSPLYSELDEMCGSLHRRIGARLVEDALLRRQAPLAVRYARALLALDPYGEAWHEAIMRAHLQMDNATAARAQLESYRRILALELGELPAAQFSVPAV
jgi:DNA-binding SARP family transcriptional activator